MKRHLAWLGVVLIATLVAADDAKNSGGAAQKERLAAAQDLVGQWRGVGQPQRGSSKGSWIETADWAWKFGEGGPSLVLAVERGKYFSTAELRAGQKEDELLLLAKTASGDGQVTYHGRRDKEGQLVFSSDQPPDAMPARVSLRLIAGGKRLVVLLEKAGASGKSFARLAEIGYTRQGSGFGQGGSGPECVVTGGFGSIEVSYNGQKYFVCCTGCRDYFNENPEEVLADYKARQEEKKKKQADAGEGR